MNMTQPKRHKYLPAQAERFLIWALLGRLIFTLVACAPKETPVATEIQSEETQAAKTLAKPRISVVEFDNITSMPGIETRIAVSLEQVLQESKRFIVIERNEVAKILREQNLNLARITSSPQNDKPITPIAGLDYLVTGTIANADAQLVTDTQTIIRTIVEVKVKFIRLVPPNPGKIQATARTISLTGQDTERMVGDLIKSINAAFPIEGRIAQVTTEKVYLNIGADDGVKIDQIFDVYQMGVEIIDPETKMSKHVEEKVGTLVIIAVQSELSIATRETAMSAAETGLRVRSQEKAEVPPPIEMIENRIAIEAFTNESANPDEDWLGEAIQGPLSTALSEAKGFSLVEREHIGQIDKELYLQGSGIIDPRSQVKLGKLWGARYIISGSYTKLGKYWRIDARRLDTQTGQVFEAEGLLSKEKEWNKLVEELGEKLRASLEQAQFQESDIKEIQISDPKYMKEVPTSIYHLLTNSKFLHSYSLVEYTLKNTSDKQSYRVMVSTQIQGYSHVQLESGPMMKGDTGYLYRINLQPDWKDTELLWEVRTPDKIIGSGKVWITYVLGTTGEKISRNENVKLEIPAYVIEDMPLTIIPIQENISSSESELIPVGIAYRIGPVGLQLEKEVKLTLRANSPILIKPSCIALYRWDEVNQKCEYTQSQMEEGYYSAMVKQGGIYSLQADTVIPMISNLRTDIHEQRLFIGGGVSDQGSGVRGSSLQITVNGQKSNTQFHDNHFSASIVLPYSETYYVSVKIEDRVGNIATVKQNIKVKPVHEEFARSRLGQNYPNPANPETWVPYNLKVPAYVTIRIYNSAGQLIRTLYLGYKDAGVYETKARAVYWDGRNDSGDFVASGVYFYVFSAGDFMATKKLVLMR